MNVVLVGMKNSGKTIVGKEVAKSISHDFVDTDDLVLNQYNIDCNSRLDHISSVYNKIGSLEFGELEVTELKKLQNSQNVVISTGGRIFLSSGSEKLLKSLGQIIYLYLTKAQFVERINKSVHDTYLKKQNLDEVYFQRDSILKQLTKKTVIVGGQTVLQISNEVQGLM